MLLDLENKAGELGGRSTFLGFPMCAKELHCTTLLNRANF